MKVIIDRFEGSFAVIELENKEMIKVPRQLIPPEAAEGSVLQIAVDQVETEKRIERISDLANDLFK